MLRRGPDLPEQSAASFRSWIRALARQPAFSGRDLRYVWCTRAIGIVACEAVRAGGECDVDSVSANQLCRD